MQCKALRDSAREIKRFNVAYFMTSVDDLETNTAFAEEHQAGFPILSDPSKEMSSAYGVLGASGFNNRWTYYIGSDAFKFRLLRNLFSERRRDWITLRIIGLDN